MKNTFRKAIATGLLLALTSSFAACASSQAPVEAGTVAPSAPAESEAAAQDQDQPAENVTLVVGANITPHAEILEFAKPLLEEQGITLEIVQLEDSITPNTGVTEGSLDANYFQHDPYLDQYNLENGTDIVSVGKIHYEPFGIYAGQTTSLDALPEGAVVAVPNNVTNEARALLLLDQEGIITLSEDAGINATVEDIVENPLNIQFEELAHQQLVAALPDEDVAVINGNYAIEGGLSVKDALAVEANDGLAAQTYGNIIATSPDKANDPAILALVEVLQGPEVAQFINDTYDGAVVPLYGE